MEADPFQNFEEQQRSYELLGEHRQALVADALDLLRDHPGFELVGLILEADASEARGMREALEKATGQSFAGKGFLGGVPRGLVLPLLRANAPASLDWLPPSTLPDGTQALPLAVVTKGGVLFGVVRYT